MTDQQEPEGNTAVESAAVEQQRPPVHEPTPKTERTTRKRMPFWDRIRLVLLFVALWFVLVWADVADNPLMTFEDSMRLRLQDGQWLLWLAGIEVVRQLHFLISEFWSGYHTFWTKYVFGGTERFLKKRLTDWTRYRLSRLIKFLFVVALLAVVLGQILDTSPLLALFEAPALLWNALPMIFQLVFAFFFIAFQFIGLFWLLTRGGVDTYFPDDIKTRFSDVWGQDQVVERVKENIVFLEDPDTIEAKGGYVPSGLLLWGPPGTGKTLMAEAVAGETGKPYVFVDPGAFTNMFMGVGILKVKSLFRKLRKLALRYGGVIVFFDEADSLGSRGALAQVRPGGAGRYSPFSPQACHGQHYLSEPARYLVASSALNPVTPEPDQPQRGWNRFVMGGMAAGGAGMGTLQALLTELSGLKKPRGLLNRYGRRILGMRPKPPPKYRILVMMATNMPEALDEALLRPGRIDRIYKVGYPTKAGRLRTYQGYLDKVKHELTPEQIDKLATITPYATGATIKDLVNEALIIAIRDGRDVITWQDITKAKHLKELGPSQNVDYVQRERHAVAVHEACHAVVAYRIREHLQINIATIEIGDTYLGMVGSIKPEDQFTTWRSEYEADILTSLASLAGERMFFDGDSTSGVSGDLHSATLVATQMEALWGMGSTVTSYQSSSAFQIGMPGGRGHREDEPNARQALADRIEDHLSASLKRAGEILQENRAYVLAIAHALETHKTLSGEDIEAIMTGTVGPLVDGRIYTDPDFQRQLEEYHEEVVKLRRGQTATVVQLPQVPELEGAAHQAAAERQD
ncbi:ATPase family associated with various cellular activities (AAA) [Pseudonocardia thermophila]|jgi:ATP-dependent Zn proteases|uniref:ATPase family associated with various cellular activities (AAA) n=1 Tax=Pseudonocardia thermophila TaxID=1848 RepID=A0A1M6VL26_PSETH|nr:AAA family ATPase [Pseudonocardia thermophila]SHK82064.1 ATPase family associated with various cellular activities (AAA) [Pseudonocardia thermophila]